MKKFNQDFRIIPFREKVSAALEKFESAGLEAVRTDNSGLIILGGRKVTKQEYGYEIDEPVFNIWQEGDKYFANVRNLEGSLKNEPFVSSPRYDGIESATDFIISYINDHTKQES